MTELYGNPVLGKLLFAGEDVISLLVAGIEPGRELKQHDPELHSAIQGQECLLEPAPQFFG